jgi:hypothetical protein
MADLGTLKAMQLALLKLPKMTKNRVSASAMKKQKYNNIEFRQKTRLCCESTIRFSSSFTPFFAY